VLSSPRREAILLAWILHGVGVQVLARIILMQGSKNWLRKTHSPAMAKSEKNGIRQPAALVADLLEIALGMTAYK
jgi:hypothetical protein